MALSMLSKFSRIITVITDFKARVLYRFSATNSILKCFFLLIRSLGGGHLMY